MDHYDYSDANYKINNLIFIVKKYKPKFNFSLNPNKLPTTWDFEMKLFNEIKTADKDDVIIWCQCIEEIYDYCKKDYDYMPRNNRLMIFFKICLGSTVGKFIKNNPLFLSKIKNDIIKIW